MTQSAPGDASRNGGWQEPAVLVLAGLLAASLVPLLFLGPGTDLDAASVVHTGRLIVDKFHYTPSRPPGTPVYEASVGVLHQLGGVPLANLGSLVMAAVAIAALWRLLRDSGMGSPALAVAVAFTNPWFLVAASSIQDFLWALAFLLVGLVLLRSHRPWAAGLLFGLAIGSRSTTLPLVLVAVVAALWGDSTERREGLLAGAVGALLGGALFVPAYLSAGRSFRFLHNDFAMASPWVQVGRFAVKDLYLFGPVGALVLVFAIPAVLAARARWRSSWLLRFSVLGLLCSQLLFLRFPWKMGHLLPTVVFVAMILGLALPSRSRLVGAVVVAQLLYCLVTVNLFVPDHPNRATTMHVEVTTSWGPLVRDTQCRSRYRHDALSLVREVHERAGICASPFGTDEP